MAGTEVFADTYALIELAKGNPHALESLTNGFITTQFNTVELVDWIIRDRPQDSEGILLLAERRVRNLSHETIRSAGAFHAAERKRNLSYADCVGYVFAREHSLPFVTGDKQFKDLPGVRLLGKH